MILRCRPEGKALWTTLANCPATQDANLMLVKFRETVNEFCRGQDVELECLADDGSLAAHLRLEREDWIDPTGAPIPGRPSIVADEVFEAAIRRADVRAACKRLVLSTDEAAEAMETLGVVLEGLPEEKKKKRKKGSKKERKEAKKRRKEAKRRTKAAGMTYREFALRHPGDMHHGPDARGYVSGGTVQQVPVPGPTYTVQMRDPHGTVHEATGVRPAADGSAEIEFPDGSTASLPAGTLDPGPPRLMLSNRPAGILKDLGEVHLAHLEDR